MIETEVIKYSIQNLYERKSRSLLTILSIMIGVASIFIFASFGLGLYNYINEIAESTGVDLFIVQARGIGAPGTDQTFRLEDKDLKAIERTQGVKMVSYWYLKPGEIEKDSVRKYVYVAGISTEPDQVKLVETMITVGIEKGRQFVKGDRGRVVLGNSYMVADKIFSVPYKVGDRITINGKKFDIIGFYESVGNPQDDSNIYMPEEDLKVMFPDISYAMLIGKVVNGDKIDDVVQRVEKNLRKVREVKEGQEDFFVSSFADQLEMFTSVIDIVVGFIALIVVISAIVASINTANTMVTSVLERVQEIGIMKSIGSTNDKIRDIFLLESSILGFVAGVLGVGFGWMLAAFGGRMLSNLGWSFLAPDFTISLFLGCIGLATLVGAISGVFPAIYASKQNVVDALRYE